MSELRTISEVSMPLPGQAVGVYQDIGGRSSQDDRYLIKATAAMRGKDVRRAFQNVEDGLTPKLYPEYADDDLDDIFSDPLSLVKSVLGDMLTGKKDPLERSGATAVMAYVGDGHKIITANLGDSRVGLLVHDPKTGEFKFHALTKDQNHLHEKEKTRVNNLIRKNNPQDEDIRFEAPYLMRLPHSHTRRGYGLQPTRNFGNEFMRPYVVTQPAVRHFDLQKSFGLLGHESLWLVVGSDGVEIDPTPELRALRAGYDLSQIDHANYLHGRDPADMAMQFAFSAEQSSVRDNKTCLIAPLSHTPRPGHNFALVISDGNGRDGGDIAEAVVESFDESLPDPNTLA